MRAVAELAVSCGFEDVGKHALECVLCIPQPNSTNSWCIDQDPATIEDEKVSRDRGVAALRVAAANFGGLLNITVE